MGSLKMEPQINCKSIKLSFLFFRWITLIEIRCVTEWSYLSPCSCWLKNDIAFYVAVVAYFCVVFLLNLSMFIVVMVQLCRIKRQNPHNLQHRSVLQDLRSVAGLTVLLGLTWGFAFFAWDAVNLPFMYLFAIFNSLQGMHLSTYCTCSNIYLSMYCSLEAHCCCFRIVWNVMKSQLSQHDSAEDF